MLEIQVGDTVELKGGRLGRVCGLGVSGALRVMLDGEKPHTVLRARDQVRFVSRLERALRADPEVRS